MRGNVLFVEDEQALQMTVGDRLRNEGYAVDCRANRNGETVLGGHG